MAYLDSRADCSQLGQLFLVDRFVFDLVSRKISCIRRRYCNESHRTELRQAYYQVWTAEQECRVYKRQSADHSNVIEQSQSAIQQQEKQTEELFVTRREQQKVGTLLLREQYVSRSTHESRLRPGVTSGLHLLCIIGHVVFFYAIHDFKEFDPAVQPWDFASEPSKTYIDMYCPSQAVQISAEKQSLLQRDTMSLGRNSSRHISYIKNVIL